MAKKIGLISDPHASAAPLAEALKLFKREKVDLIICAGDIAGYFDELDATVDLLVDFDCQSIIGNHDQSYMESHPDAKETPSYRFLQDLPETLELTIEGKRIYIVHAEPPLAQHGGIKLLDLDGNVIPERISHWSHQLKNLDYDVLIVGHTHQVFNEKIGGLLVINPGSCKFNHTCMILNLPDLSIELFSLENKPPLKAWNWGIYYQQTNTEIIPVKKST